jgi:hypothetical protein
MSLLHSAGIDRLVMKRKSSPIRRLNKLVRVAAQISSVPPAGMPLPIATAKMLEVQLRKEHAALEKLVANQSLEPKPGGDKIAAKLFAGKPIKPGDGIRAAHAKT